MTLQLTPELASALAQRAAEQGTSPEEAAVDALRAQLLPRRYDLTPRDEWEREVLANTAESAAVLTDEDLRRENMYD